MSTIHGFCADLLRERPVEARIDPLFEVLTESASARLFDAAFAQLAAGAAGGPARRPPPGVRRSAFGGDDGPIDRLRKAAWELAQWRDFTGAWMREPFDRRHEIDTALGDLHAFAELTRRASSPNDPLHTGTEPARRLSDEIALQRSSGEEHAADYDGWEAALVDLSKDRTLANAKTGRGAGYRDGVTRDRVLQARVALKARLDQFRMTADADLAALLQRDLRGAIDRYDELKARAGALDFSICCCGRAISCVTTRRAARLPAPVQAHLRGRVPGHRPAPGGILLLLAADNDDETDWRRARPRPGTLFLVGDPKQSIYRFRRADVGVYREVCERLAALGATLLHLNTSFRSVPEIQACVNRRSHRS